VSDAIEQSRNVCAVEPGLRLVQSDAELRSAPVDEDTKRDTLDWLLRVKELCIRAGFGGSGALIENLESELGRPVPDDDKHLKDYK
jgi:hypothetical protein